MSDRNLPDDPTLWPEDPSKLLGVPFFSPLRELRRAYTRLIRIYKPEQFPEQFRRIRQAFDHMLPYARTDDSPAEADRPVLPMPQREPDEPVAATPPSASAEPVIDEERHPEDSVDDLWRTAVRGDLRVAYRRLVELSSRFERQADIYQRLWWLLSCDSTLTDAEVPADWLVRGLRATGFAGPLLELYRVAIEEDPHEAFTERFASLSGSATTLSTLAELLQWRIRAAGRLDDWQAVAVDIDRYRQRFETEEERTWLRLLFALADGCAWSNASGAGELTGFCMAQIKRFDYLSAEMSGFFDRFDWLMEFAPGYRQLSTQGQVPRELLQVLRLAWSTSFPEIFPILEPLLEQMATNPEQWVNHLDLVNTKSSGALALFGEALDQYARWMPTPPVEEPEWDNLVRLVRNFLADSFVTGELNWHRGRLLRLCLREVLTVEQIAECAAGQVDEWSEPGKQLARVIRKDWPIRYVSRAWQLFRA